MTVYVCVITHLLHYCTLLYCVAFFMLSGVRVHTSDEEAALEKVIAMRICNVYSLTYFTTVFHFAVLISSCYTLLYYFLYVYIFCFTVLLSSCDVFQEYGSTPQMSETALGKPSAMPICSTSLNLIMTQSGVTCNMWVSTSESDVMNLCQVRDMMKLGDAIKLNEVWGGVG